MERIITENKNKIVEERERGKKQLKSKYKSADNN